MRAVVLSSPERAALGVALAVLVLQWADAGAALEYRRSALAHEPWRVLTGHLVHVGWPHALVNAAALWMVARLFAPDLDARRQMLVLGLSALAVGAALAGAYPGIEWYRGLSGALHGLFFAGAAKWLATARPRTWSGGWLPATLFAGGWIKVVVEQPGGATTPYAEWLGAAVVPQAHLAGAFAGTVLGALAALAQARRQRQRAEQ